MAVRSGTLSPGLALPGTREWRGHALFNEAVRVARSVPGIGVFIDVVYYCLDPSSTGHAFHVVAGDVPPGPTTYTDTAADYKLDLSATLEPDADLDGFGDETQDECPTDASTQGTCPPDTDPPNTEITKGAPNKLDKSKVKFKFASDEPGSTFECKLDKKKFKPCTSPRKVKHLDEGKHKFKVRAIDAAGNVDPFPAKDKFKVVG